MVLLLLMGLMVWVLAVRRVTFKSRQYDLCCVCLLAVEGFENKWDYVDNAALCNSFHACGCSVGPSTADRHISDVQWLR